MGCSTVRRQVPVKKIIILPVGSYCSFRRRIRWDYFLMLAWLPQSIRSRSRQGTKKNEEGDPQT
jgi:hypothetical protein